MLGTLAAPALSPASGTAAATLKITREVSQLSWKTGL